MSVFYLTLPAVFWRVSCITARTVEVESCPDNVTSTVTSLRRTSHVTWAEPVFIGAGGRQLDHDCSVHSGSEFFAGANPVVCYPRDYPAVTCHFVVNVVGKSRPFTPTSGWVVRRHNVTQVTDTIGTESRVSSTRQLVDT